MNLERVREILASMHAGNELTEELASELMAAAAADPALMQEIKELEQVCELLRTDPGPYFGDGSDLRIRARIQEEEGVPMSPSEPEPAPGQLSLFLQT